MIFKEVSYEYKTYLYTAELNNGVTVHAFGDGTGEGSDGRKYRLTSYIDHCEFYDVFDEVVVEGWELIAE